MRGIVTRQGWVLLGLGLFAAQTRAQADFHADVAPILERACLSCHDDAKRKGGLSLASAAGLKAGGHEGAVVVPGNPEASPLIEMVSGQPPLMPRKGVPLTGAEVDTLRDWIRAGAPWPERSELRGDGDAASPEAWWSLRALSVADAPALDDPWIRNPVDAFVLAALRERGLEPSPEIDRRRLARRLSFDLHGLPLAPGRLDAFVADDAPDAYERLVDEMLASPRYGERWGRHWLDVVHYGETHGFDKDKMRPNAWPFRDWVIRALNEDLPYADFVRAQIAGDVLSPDDPQAIVATGFLAAGPWDFVGHVELREGTRDKRITRLLDRDDMLTAVMSTFASTTVHCARCHDHKFDPIPQRDYYALQAVFAGIDRADRPYDEDPAVHRRRRELVAEIGELEPRATSVERRLAAQDDAELREITDRLQELRAQRDALPGEQGASPTNGWHSAILHVQDTEQSVTVDLGEARELSRIRLIPARPVDFPDTPGFGFPPRFRVEVSDRADFSPARTLAEHLADFPNPGDVAVEIEVGGAPTRYVRVTATKLWKRHEDYVFALAELEAYAAERNVALGAAVTAPDSVEAGLWGARNLVDGFDSREFLGDESDRDARAAERTAVEGHIAAAEAEDAHARMSRLPADVQEEARRVRRRLADLRAEAAALPEPKLVFAAANDFASQGNFIAARLPRPVHFLHRGDVDQEGEAVPPAALSAWPDGDGCFEDRDFAQEAQRRAALAEWLVHPDHPLSWRTIVNRLWQYHFGRGLVTTPNDFGRMGSPPTHPALLDWLARHFRDGGGSMKELHRLLVTSATYRQSSAPRADCDQVDGENRLLWRMNRRRLEAEVVRDTALAVADRLDLQMGGPSQQWFEVEQDHSPRYLYERYDPAGAQRRSIYRFVVRSVPDPFLECLDCPDPSRLTPQRNTTLTALQALSLLNDRFMVTQARNFAERLRAAAPELDGQIRHAWEIALARSPEDDELNRLVPYAREHGLENLCRLMFNLNEFQFVD